MLMAKAMGRSNTKKSMATTSQKAAEEKEEYLCYCCGEKKKKSLFYASSDPFNGIGVTPFCKNCIEKIARNYSSQRGQYGEVTKASLCEALERIDLPYLDKLWESSYNEVHDPSLKQPKTNVWSAYIKNVKLPQYNGMRWRDGDLFKENEEEIHFETVTLPQNQEVLEECEKNRKDIIRLIGYDPFEKEAAEDKPLLYAQLIGYIDTEGNNDDMTRILDSIEIVRGYLQLQKINDMSAKAFSNLAQTGNSGEIKNYMDTKKKVADVISQLAEQSCISLKHNKNAKKGENTWTGKIKAIKDMNLREGEVNGFDIATCKAMQQVMDLSNASIMKQLRLDESEYSDMIAQQREMIVKLTKERDSYQEISRILLRENLDLKNVLTDNDLLDSTTLVDLKDLYSPFNSTYSEENDVEEEEDDEQA